MGKALEAMALLAMAVSGVAWMYLELREWRAEDERHQKEMAAYEAEWRALLSTQKPLPRIEDLELAAINEDVER